MAVLAGCGEEDRQAEQAAARDTSVQVATASAEPATSARKVTRPEAAPAGVLRGSYERLNGRRDNLARYRGDVVLVVNTATACGFAPQFEGLEQLYRERKAEGLVVLGFPANDFGGQEPRSSGEIAEFCKANYGVTFPMFARTAVTGDRATPLFRSLAAKAGAPEWNFNKYVVDRRGSVVARFGAGTEPDASELTRKLDGLL